MLSSCLTGIRIVVVEDNVTLRSLLTFRSRTFCIRSQKNDRARLKHPNFIRRIAGPVEKTLIPGHEAPVIIVNDGLGQSKLL
jgi:hypothetical protein